MNAFFNKGNTPLNTCYFRRIKKLCIIVSVKSTLYPFSMRKSLFLSLFIIVLGQNAKAQVVTLNPPFVTQQDTVEVIFDATQGNAALVGVTPVYAHTGVITNLSTSPTDWRHVQGTWGTPDPKVLMTSIGNNRHRLKYHINTFYNVPAGETVQSLAFVFRNANGSIVGRATGGGDIFVPISAGGFQATFTTPTTFSINSVNDSLDLTAQTSARADLKIYHESTIIAQSIDTTRIDFKLPMVNYGAGRFNLVFEATHTSGVYRDTVSYLARNSSKIAFDTSYFEEGITILNDSSIALKLLAPFKQFIYVIGDFNNWQVQPEYEMYKSPADDYFWLIIDDLDPAMEYAFQYYIDEEGLRVADAYSEKILDPWNDGFITSSVYPNLKPYPTGKTSFPVSVVQTVDPNPYQWQNTSFKKPANEELVIYELLIRDFDSRHTYQSVIDRLPYLDSLGINAIELMPVMEFEGNESWGYNPMFFMAPDKYYGTKNDFKAMVDSCHGRGMAVILDIALNHAFGQCPLVRMYFDGTNPTSQSPWFNIQPKHDFNVGYDFNHNSAATKYFVKRVYQHWVKEYKVDGYRMDLSKGYTQKNTLGNVAAWGQYDAARISTLQRIKNEVEEIDTAAIMILEHFADNTEEIELSNRGFLLWGNENHQYNEASMGYPSNLGGVFHQNRNWPKPNLVGYMESHDEERLMYKNINFGKVEAGYSTKDIPTALDRMALDAAFFFTIPGPKMLWQFGEMGYDFSINRCPDGTVDPGCRLANKPIRWDYLKDQNRLDLFSEYANIIKLRNSYPNVFQTSNATTSLSGFIKQITLQTNDSSAVVAGNFDVASRPVSLSFPKNGSWYDFATGDSIMVNGMLDTTYAAGEYHIYLNFKAKRTYNVSINEDEPTTDNYAVVFPNPGSGKLFIEVGLEHREEPVFTLMDISGREVLKHQFAEVQQGQSIISVNPALIGKLPAGLYAYKLKCGISVFSGKLILQ